jgi:hypothetical protein
MEKLLGIPREKSVTFPLPAGALPEVKLTVDDANNYRETTRTIVDATVAMERHYRLSDNGEINTEDWKLATEKEGIRVYRRMARTDDSGGNSEQQKHQPMVMCLGRIPGTIEEALYGLREETTDEIRALSSVVNEGFLDAAIVAVMNRGTRDDPFRLLALKWRINATPCGGLIRNRDMFLLESMGIEVDESGERFGHLLLKSVDRPDFPPFSKSIAVRSTLAFCCIFRQVTPDTVGIYAKGVLNLGGDVPDWFNYAYICPRLSAILETSQGLTVKRMTALAIKKSRVFAPMSATKLGFSRMHSGSSSASDHSNPDQKAAKDGPVVCAVCQRRGGSRLLLRPSLQRCQICDCSVCTKCLLRQELLAMPANIQALCCKACVLESKTLPVRPNALSSILYQ